MDQAQNIEPKGRRRPRAAFTKTLEKILARVETGRQCIATWLPLYDYNKVSTSFQVEKMWVVGSYARGAATCGDLDLLMEVKILSGGYPPEKKTAKAAVGSFPDVTIFIGTPEKNSSRVPFPDAILLWSREAQELSWKDVLARIEVDDKAQRFQREYDMLPFRKEQICYGDLEYIIPLTEALKEKKITAEWVSIEELASIPPSAKAESWIKRLGHIGHGKKSLEAFKIALPWLLQRFKGAELEWGSDRASLFTNKFEVRTGCSPIIPLFYLLDGTAPVTCVMPHITRRGPNGLWILKPKKKRK